MDRSRELLDGNRNFGSPDIVNLEVCKWPCSYSPKACDLKATFACTQESRVYSKVWKVPGLADNHAGMSTCPAWDELHLLVERKRKDVFGDNDSILMLSRGSLFLHELTHFRVLNEKSYYFLSRVQGQLQLNQISDFVYGPWAGNQLVIQAAPFTSFSPGNADDYQYYALSKYWQQNCPKNNGGKRWGTALGIERPGPPLGDDGKGNCRLRDVYDDPIPDCSVNMVPQPGMVGKPLSHAEELTVQQEWRQEELKILVVHTDLGDSYLIVTY